MSELKKRIQNYWDKRSKSFRIDRQRELENDKINIWKEELEKYIPNDKTYKILDIGTGTGFFAILLAKMGHEVYAIDISKKMLEEARDIARLERLNINFKYMDSENLEFSDKSFDIVISRNVMWTLENPKRAYSEWIRVIKPGGKLINFDANHGQIRYADIAKDKKENSGLDIYDMDMLKECDRISENLFLSKLSRPNWDEKILGELKVSSIEIDIHAGERLYEKEYCKSFCICAKVGG